VPGLRALRVSLSGEGGLRAAFSAVLLAGALAYFALAWVDLPFLSPIGRPGPGFFPRMIGAGLALLLAIDLWARLRQRDPGAPFAPHLRTLLSVVGLCVGFVVLLPLLGALLAMILFMLAALAVLNPGRWPLNLTLALLLPIGLHLVFAVWLRASLPEGLLRWPF
jgi:putative tricarboxylic transport membrane protein